MAELPSDVEQSPTRPTQSVLQVCDMLGMYRAELARVLGVMCGDIGRLGSAREMLVPGSESWERARLFIRFYRALYAAFDGNEAAIGHWLRADHAELEGSPLLLMVDEGRLAQLVEYVEKSLPPPMTVKR